jgi:hypothetical protein
MNTTGSGFNLKRMRRMITSIDRDPGSFVLTLNGVATTDYSLNLWNGLATLTAALPSGAKIGDILCFDTMVSDVSRVEPFASKFCIQVEGEEQQQPRPSSKGGRKNPPRRKKGVDRRRESYLDLPNVVPVKREDWNNERYKEFGFNEFSALKIKYAGDGSGYDFFINLDNSFLKAEMKGDTKTDPAVLEARYRYGMVLLGISIIDFEENRQKDKKKPAESKGTQLTVEDKISLFTEAVAPSLLPMIASLGSGEFGV